MRADRADLNRPHTLRDVPDLVRLADNEADVAPALRIVGERAQRFDIRAVHALRLHENPVVEEQFVEQVLAFQDGFVGMRTVSRPSRPRKTSSSANSSIR